jgi:hypothetical protein
MGAPIHGKNGLIYVSGTELIGANAWSIDMGLETAEAPKFGDTWKQHVAGLLTWSGTISAWEQTDEQLLVQAATAGIAVALLVYPARGTLTDYYSGDAIFGASADGSTTSAVAKNGTFTGDGTLTVAGFT